MKRGLIRSLGGHKRTLAGGGSSHRCLTTTSGKESGAPAPQHKPSGAQSGVSRGDAVTSLNSSTQLDSSAPKERLPKLPTTYDQEFTAGDSDKDEKALSLRLFDAFMTKANIPMVLARKTWVQGQDSAATIAASAAFVLCIGAYEGSLLLQHPASWDGAAFIGTYAFEQLLPSCVWETADAKLVALSLGHSPEAITNDLLRTFGDTPEDASALLRRAQLHAVRSIVAGFTLVTQIVRTMLLTGQAMEAHRQNVMAGREPPNDPEGSGGRVIRLCGNYSDTTVISLSRYGNSIFPVFEDPAKVYGTVVRYSKNGLEPVFWCVKPTQYEKRWVWDGLPLGKKWLIKTSSGRSMFVVEADLTDEQDSLSLGRRSTDLTFNDASTAFRILNDKMKKALAVSELYSGEPHKFRQLRVVLGDSFQLFRSGGGHAYTLRDRVVVGKEADVLLDSRAVVMKELLKFSTKANRSYAVKLKAFHEGATSDQAMKSFGTDNSGCATLCFDTSDATYFDNLKDLLTHFGIQVIDIDQATKLWRATGGKVGFPYLIYHRTTAKTVGRVHALVTSKAIDMANACVLVDKPQGVEDLLQFLHPSKSSASLPVVDALNEFHAKQKGFKIICTAALLDDVLYKVRSWARMGYSSAAIQAEIDFDFRPLLDQIQRSVQTRKSSGDDEPADGDVGKSTPVKLTAEAPAQPDTGQASVRPSAVVK